MCVTHCAFLFKCNEIADSDRRGCLVGVRIEDLFQEDQIKASEVGTRSFNPITKSYRHKFVEKH